jgi:hypothetical protein
MAQGDPFLGAGSGSPPGVQNVITNLQNLVVAVNALTTTLAAQSGTAAAINTLTAALTTPAGPTITYPVASLPAGSTAALAFVSDSTVAAAGNFGAIVVGGGSFLVPVYRDLAGWKIG